MNPVDAAGNHVDHATYQREAAAIRRAARALMVSAKTPGVPDAPAELVESTRDIALSYLREAVITR